MLSQQIFAAKMEIGHMTSLHMLSVDFSHSRYFVGYLERAGQELSENIYICGVPMHIWGVIGEEMKRVHL